VRANGVRAVGCLLALPPAGGGDGCEDWSGPQWLAWRASALQSLQSCLATGNVKVQWNASVAAAALLRSQPAALQAQSVGTLLVQLVMLLRDSQHFKVRAGELHGAAGLRQVPAAAAAAAAAAAFDSLLCTEDLGLSRAWALPQVRTHAAAALCALGPGAATPALGASLADALLVTAAALEGLEEGGAGAAALPAAGPGGAGSAAAADDDLDSGRIPNYR
jgi:hypothetical protein